MTIDFRGKPDDAHRNSATGGTTAGCDLAEGSQPHPGPSKTIDLIGGGGRTRTYDLRIMSRPSDSDSKQLQQFSSAKRGKPKQNPQTIRKQKGGKENAQ